MRFDDMFATVLAQPAATASARAVRWRQMVDIVAQRGAAGGAAGDAFGHLRAEREHIRLGTRVETARMLAGRRLPAGIIAFFAEDHPAVAAPVITGARLAPEEWIELLPRLGPTGRALLRHRRDLDPQVARALAHFGSADLVLEPAAAAGEAPGEAEPASAEGEAQIRDLVARIEAFRRLRESPPASAPPPRRATGFAWESDAYGVIVWIEGAPREPLVGRSIAIAAGEAGVDGQAAGAFDKRAPFRDARLSIAGSGAAAGEWRISGVPFFAREDGRFLGYRGLARRPRADETALPAGLFGTGLSSDALRQLIHELKTPLNAIVGFAEMIEGEYLGPAETGYKARAREIVGLARHLLVSIDYLDSAARGDGGGADGGTASVDSAALLERLAASFEDLARHRGARIALALGRDLPCARIAPATIERMVSRLLSAAVGLA
ncbi:MAG: sensor histidine kinase, partial [Sphingomonadaceae bacterium]